MKIMHPILFRLLIAPCVFVVGVVAIFMILIVQIPFWIITGEDFLMDRYFPFCDDIYQRFKIN